MLKAPDANQILLERGPDGLREAIDAATTFYYADLTSPDKGEHGPEANRARVLSSAEFIEGFVPPDYLIDGIIQRHRIYSNTGVTGCGKTAIMLRLLAQVALGKTLGGRDVAQGRCLMLVGENPDDVRARWIALSEQMGFFPDEIDVHFMPGIYPLAELIPLLDEKAKELGGIALIAVDTGAAFFDGFDENDNKQMGDYARRLRFLCELPGQPCVIVNTHPTKNASTEHLLPRGGGAFLNEVDGNLCSSKEGDNMVQMHWQGKFRGPDFAPIYFELITVTSQSLIDTKGRMLPTVYARPLTDAESVNCEARAERDQKKLLVAIAENEGASLADLAEKLGWRSTTGTPLKSKVHRLLEKLKAQKLAKNELNKWILTPAGQKLAAKVAEETNE